MVEAEVEVACNARDGLPAIPVPVLLVCGDEDRYFPKEVYEETARLIPDCTLRMYEGAGHVGATRDRRFPRDVLRSGGPSEPLEVAPMRMLVSMAMLTIVAALAPVTLSRYDLTDHQVWALSSALILAGWFLIVVVSSRTPEYRVVSLSSAIG